MRRVLMSLIFCGVALGCATPSVAKPEAYTLDGAHTHITWKVDRFGFTRTVGSFTDISGHLILDEKVPQNSSVTATISLSGLRSDLAERENIIRGSHWLDVQNHPVITFTSTDVIILADEDGRRVAEVVGDLMLKGKSAPVTMKVYLNKVGIEPPSQKKAMGFSAAGNFERDDFGVNTALKFIGNVVEFEIEALAVKAD